MRDALVRFSKISELNAKMFIVASEDRRREYDENIRIPAFSIIRELQPHSNTTAHQNLNVETNRRALTSSLYKEMIS